MPADRAPSSDLPPVMVCPERSLREGLSLKWQRNGAKNSGASVQDRTVTKCINNPKPETGLHETTHALSPADFD